MSESDWDKVVEVLNDDIGHGIKEALTWVVTANDSDKIALNCAIETFIARREKMRTQYERLRMMFE